MSNQDSGMRPDVSEDMVRDLLKKEPDTLTTDEDVLAFLRQDAIKGLENLYHFDKYILGYKDMAESTHKPLCDFIEAGKRKKLILMPRGSFKSSVVTIGRSLQRICRDPNIRILIGSEKLSNAQKFLSEIKGHMVRNEYFRLLYGKLDTNDDNTWNQTEIVVSTRTKNLKEPTISTAGVDVTKVGMHYDMIIADDPVSSSNVTSREQIDKVFNWYRLLLSLLEPGGELIIIGTRWDYGDLYGTLQEPQYHESFDYYVRSAEWIDDEGKEHLLFPERLTKKFLEEQRREQGSYVFSCTPGDAEILMADLTKKPIKDIKVGDDIIGYKIGNNKKRGTLERTKVLEINSRISSTQTIFLQSGNTVRCTPDHEWYTGRSNGDKTHKTYAPVKIGSRMICVLNDFKKPTVEEISDWRYLAGIIDGEGACKYGSGIFISQSESKNPEVFGEIQNILDRLRIKYRIYKNKKEKSTLYLHGGRSLMSKIIQYGNPAKKNQIINSTLTHRSRIGIFRDRVIDIQHDGEERVYALVTGTGNYISQGYASKNCQYQNDPVPAEEATFKHEWFKYYGEEDLKHIRLNKFMAVDPALSLEKSADYTVFVIAGVDSENHLYILKIDKGKYNPKELIDRFFDHAERYGTMRNGLETVAFQKTLKYAIEDEMRKRGRFIDVTELKHADRSKEDRIRGLQPLYENGVVFHRYDDPFTKDLEHELLHFPKSKKDDVSDAVASLLEIMYIPKKRRSKKRKRRILSKYTKW